MTISQVQIDELNAERTIPLEVYHEHGADSRFEYLQGLADNACVDFDVVLTLLTVLPPDEDFDGLVTSIEDAALMEGF